MGSDELQQVIDTCRALISERFPDGSSRGAAAVLVDDGSILTGTSPDFLNSSTDVCHEIEPYAAAFRLDRRIRASLCLHRMPDGTFVVLSPCGVCRERLAVHGPDVKLGVPRDGERSEIQWVSLREALPHYWLSVFPEEVPDWH